MMITFSLFFKPLWLVGPLQVLVLLLLTTNSRPVVAFSSTTSQSSSIVWTQNSRTPLVLHTGTSTLSATTKSSSTSSSLSSDEDDAATTTTILEIKKQLSRYVSLTDRGRSITTKEDETSVETLLTKLESYNTYAEPTRSRLTGGSWTVGYTTAPPPSNGQLGPFKGIAQQVIDMDDKTYKNILTVPPNDWLKASLDAVWEEWDGEFIEEDDESISKWTGKKTNLETTTTKAVVVDGDDYGATCWRVTFDQLTISFFGNPIFTKKFDRGTQRIWRTTYLDDDTRIVRAGRTGLPDDEIPFYMSRTT